MGNILFNEPDEVVSCKRSDRKRVIKYILFCILMVVCVFLFAAYSVKETELEAETESDTDEYVIYHIQEANDIVMHTTSELCVRNFPEATGLKIGSLKENQDVTITGVCRESGWYRIQYNGSDAYISDDYVKSGSVAVGRVAVPDPENLYVKGDKGVSDEMVLAVESEFMMIPKNVRDYIEVTGWTITVSSQDLSERFHKHSGTVGLIDYKAHAIYVNNESVAKTAVVHEIGHFIDHAKGRLSKSDEFADIYAAEKEAFCEYHRTDGHNTGEPNEYFAEAYMASIYDPVGMQEACPKTYEFVMNVSKSMKPLFLN